MSAARRTTDPATTLDIHSQDLAEALHLIAHGTADEKVRYVASRDADWFVEHVLDFRGGDVRHADDEPPRPVIDREVLDRAVARLALQGRTFPALLASA